MAETIRIIKKYQNRKLYDTQDSCYVTLDGIAKMIRDGEDILVIDNNTKADVTALILTQVLYEQEKTNQGVLPVEILKTIVKSSSNNLFEFLQRYVSGAIDAQMKAHEDIQNYLNRLVQKGDLTAQEGETLLQELKAAAEANQGSLDQKIEERLEKFLAKKAGITSPEFSTTAERANRVPTL